ncbi:hypothetical protein AVEN_68145-1 [Araneus ventricosus]|uniref:Transposon Ty3-I Gag-Pol polyprotein n=1 Tax=Araneus ventricosus TaxID=182803 RepID=A0A4Y2QKH7_ARAVE|nr:hypothetical protein AVEN_68145-1 [Araneus ventricosus]
MPPMDRIWDMIDRTNRAQDPGLATFVEIGPAWLSTSPECLSSNFRSVRNGRIFPSDCLKFLELKELADVQIERINSFSSETQNKLEFYSAILDNESHDLTHIVDDCLRDQVKHLVEEYEPAKEPKGTDLRLNVVLGDEIPVSQRLRRMPFAGQKIVDKQIDEWLEKGIIKPSCSDYASPILLTEKRDGTHRLYVDFRQRNKKVVKDSFPMPQVEKEII